MNYHPDVLAAHAEFGGDLEAMQALYDRPDHIARIAALEAKLAEMLDIAEILERNIKENGKDTHRMKINGEWYEGPAVDACRDILLSIRRAILTAISP